MQKKYLLLFAFLYATSLLQAQDTITFRSLRLNKTDSVLVFKPAHYDPSHRYPLVYLLHGYSADYRQWSTTINLQAVCDQYNFIVVCPEGFVSWYLNSPYDKRSQMEDFFFNELKPRIHQQYAIDDRNIFISGLSMGGYGALRYFLLHDDYFNTAGSTSGGLRVDYTILRAASMQFFRNERVTNDLTHLLGEASAWSQYDIVTLLKAGKGNKRPFIFDCGREDILYPVHKELQAVCDSLHIPATAITQPGNHNTEYWACSIHQHFAYFKKHLR
jgi:S-formylglutathione hydrolase FrmB